MYLEQAWLSARKEGAKFIALDDVDLIIMGSILNNWIHDSTVGRGSKVRKSDTYEMPGVSHANARK
eukprot:15346615-Ditylum_brightwellii.AAC.3